MKKAKKCYRQPLNFTGALQLLFIALKLLDKINWSWIWVLAPAWIPVAVIIVLLIIALIVGK